MNTKISFMSNAEHISRGLRVIFRTLRPRHDDLILPEIHYTSKGCEYYVYYPIGKAVGTVLSSHTYRE